MAINYELISSISSIMLPLSFQASGIIQTPSCGYVTKIEHMATPSLSILTASTSTSSGDLSVSIQASKDRSKIGTYSLEIKPFIIGFATYTAMSQISYNFIDSIDLLGSTLDYCGTK